MIQSQFVNKQKGFRTVTVQFSFLMFAGFHNQYPLLTMVNLKQQFRDVCCQQHAYGSSTELLWGGPLATAYACIYFALHYHSGELRNEALQIWRGVVCFSRDFIFRTKYSKFNIYYKNSFFIITTVLSLSRDLPQPFLTFYFNPNLHHFLNNTRNLIYFLTMTIDTKFMELIRVFLNYLHFVNYSVSCQEGDWDERKI